MVGNNYGDDIITHFHKTFVVAFALLSHALSVIVVVLEEFLSEADFSAHCFFPS